MQPCEGGRMGPVLNGCPQFTTEATSHSLANHRLKSSVLETASLTCEVKMKSLFLWRSNKAALVKVVCLWAAIQLCNGHRAGSSSGLSVTTVRPQHPEKERGRLGTQRPNISRVFLLPVHPQSAISENSMSPMAIL